MMKNAIDLMIDNIVISKKSDKIIATITYNFSNEKLIKKLNHPVSFLENF